MMSNKSTLEIHIEPHIDTATAVLCLKTVEIYLNQNNCLKLTEKTEKDGRVTFDFEDRQGTHNG